MKANYTSVGCNYHQSLRR